MKFLSFKILFLCVLLPPVLYIFSIISLEKYLNDQYAAAIEDLYIGDTQQLFNGSERLQDVINRNINAFLDKQRLVALGVRVGVVVTTKDGAILYPAAFAGDQNRNLITDSPMEIARENYDLMNAGLTLRVNVKVEHGTVVSNLILAFYILLAVSALYLHYRGSLQRAKRSRLGERKELERLLKMGKQHSERLKALGQERAYLSSELGRVRKELTQVKSSADATEEEMVEEIVALEDEIEKNLALRTQQDEEISLLREKLKACEIQEQRLAKQRKRSSATLEKRFKTLYKNIDMNPRALSGYYDLPDDMQIKCEEIIHILNDDPRNVPIKRKVFSKKGRQTVLEIVFSYNGRLYYRSRKDKRLEVLTIGTKNTQAKDLEFLNSIQA